jgi:choline dehydrogenase-like flavoprotein
VTITDARSIPAESILHTDVCIIGSGPAGITIAHQLRHSGLNVLVLEAGGFKIQPDYKVEGWTLDEVGRPLRHDQPARGRGFGGSTEYWFRRIAMPDPIDFEQRPWVPHSGWPIAPEDLDSWNPVAADILGLAHLERLNIDRWEPSPTVRLFRRPGESDLRVFLWCDVQNPAAHLRSMMKNSETITVLLNASALELMPSETPETIESLIVRSSSDATFTVRAGAYVLSAGGLENPRLMLSSNSRSEAGLGNKHDLVGRFFMDHPRGEGIARLDLSNATRSQVEVVRLLGEKADSDVGHTQLRITFDPALQRREELLNHSMHAHLVTPVHESPAFRSTKRLLANPRRTRSDVGTVLKGSPQLVRFSVSEMFGRSRPSAAIFVSQMEQEPDPLSRVTVNHRRRDDTGLPMLELDWRVGQSTFRSQRYMVQMVRDILREAGLDHFESEVLVGSDSDSELWDMKHPSGTTRMADRPEHGVVDRHCRVHGIDNLYVAGSSVFPTAGHFNPTLTIVALAARLASHIRSRIGPSRKVPREA